MQPPLARPSSARDSTTGGWQATDGAATPWAPLPFPVRRSPFYSLRSVAFSKDGVPALPAANTLANQLPRIEPLGYDAQPAAVPTTARTTASNATAAVASAAAQAEEGGTSEALISKLEAKREAALVDYKKLQEQLRGLREKVDKERQVRLKAESQTKELRSRAKAIDAKARKEHEACVEQQRELRTLRSMLKELQAKTAKHPRTGIAAGAGASVMSAPASTQQSSVAHGPKPQVADLSSDDDIDVGLSRVLRDIAVASQAGGQAFPAAVAAAAAAVAATEAPAAAPVHVEAEMAPEADVEDAQPLVGLDAGLEGLLSEMQKVKEACDPPPGGVEQVERRWRPQGCDLELNQVKDDNDEAEIEMLRRPAASAMARLRHPRGAEALIDLNEGLVAAWRLPDGSTAGPGSVPAMRPKLADGGTDGDTAGSEKVDHIPWHLTLDGLDDSNNEPSATFACDGGAFGSSWRLRRTFLLGADWLREDLVVENLSAADLRFELALVPALLPTAGPASAMLRAGGAQPAALRHSRPGGAWKTVSVPAWGRWTDAQWWVAFKQAQAKTAVDGG